MTFERLQAEAVQKFSERWWSFTELRCSVSSTWINVGKNAAEGTEMIKLACNKYAIGYETLKKGATNFSHKDNQNSYSPLVSRNNNQGSNFQLLIWQVLLHPLYSIGIYSDRHKKLKMGEWLFRLQTGKAFISYPAVHNDDAYFDY